MLCVSSTAEGMHSPSLHLLGVCIHALRHVQQNPSLSSPQLLCSGRCSIDATCSEWCAWALAATSLMARRARRAPDHTTPMQRA